MMQLPEGALNQHIAALGKTGSGKTYAVKSIVEDLLSAGKRVCVIDPTGAWWGLKASANGLKVGFPVAVFGGDHADVPLTDNAGPAVAELLGGRNLPAILDISEFGEGEKHRFVTEFAHALYRANRSPLHLVIDEADAFCPQSSLPEAKRMMGAIDKLVRRGRSRGFRVIMISQRPAVLHKNVLSQAATLIAMRLPAPQDRKAIQDWIRGQADEAEGAAVLASLSKLGRGDGWIWFPEGGVLQRTHFPKIKTFDSGRTPEDGEQIAEPQRLAEVDLATIRTVLQESVQVAEQSDPVALRKKVAALEGELRSAKAPVHAPPAKPEIVEVPVLKNGQLSRTEKILDRLEAQGQKALAEVAELRRMIAPAFPAPRPQLSPTRPRVPSAPHAPRGRPPRAPPSAANSGTSNRQQRFLDAAATLTTLGVEVTRETVAAWVGVHPRGGSVGEELKALQDAGYIVVDRGRIEVTSSGIAAATYLDQHQAIENAKAGLTERQRRFFAVIHESYPGVATREQIAERFGIHPRGGSLGEDLGRLVGRGLVERGGGGYRVRDFLLAGQEA